MAEELEMIKETVQIENGRNLYLYSFEENGKKMSPMTEKDISSNTSGEPGKPVEG